MNFLVLIPYGGNNRKEYLKDTIESVNYHFKEGNTDIIIINDSNVCLSGICYEFRNVEVKKCSFKTEDSFGNVRYGSIFVEQIKAIRKNACKKEYEVVVKMDDDTVVCGDNVHVVAKNYFDKNKKLGMLGAFTKRGDGSSKVKDMMKKGHKISSIKRMNQLVKKVRFSKSLKTALKELCLATTIIFIDYWASKNKNYVKGGTCTGGCYFISKKFVEEILKMKVPIWPLMFSSNPGEDTLMSLICYYCGFNIENFPCEKKRIAINWRGLPASLEEIVRSDISVVHPVKNIDGIKEERIRNTIKKKMRKQK